MIIAFGRTGNERKKLAWAIATIIGTTAEYQYIDRKSTRLNSSHRSQSRMPSSA